MRITVGYGTPAIGESIHGNVENHVHGSEEYEGEPFVHIDLDSADQDPDGAYAEALAMAGTVASELLRSLRADPSDSGDLMTRGLDAFAKRVFARRDRPATGETNRESDNDAETDVGDVGRTRGAD